MKIMSNSMELIPTEREDDGFHIMVPTEQPPVDLGMLTKRAFTNLIVSSKCKLMGSLYNIVHSTPTELPAFSTSPLYMLGKRYIEDPAEKRYSHIDQALNDFYSILWFSYRKDFPPLTPSQLTTDIGWGCMLRTGQMLIAHALVRHILGRDWQLSVNDQNLPYSTYRQILRWFGDNPSPKCPYSIHNIVNINRQIDELHQKHSLATFNKPGEYFSPTRVCKIFKYLVRDHSPEALTMHVPKEGVVYRDKIIELCTSSGLYTRRSPKPKKRPPSSEGEGEDKELFWRPLVILIPLRLGVDSINKLYIPVLKAMFKLPQNIGIIGGRPKQSLYFVGFQDDQVLYLDPHIVRPAGRDGSEFLHTYHCNTPRVMPFESVDPSLAIGFYISNQVDWEKFCDSIQAINAKESPVFTIEDVSPTYNEYDSEEELNDVVVV